MIEIWLKIWVTERYVQRVRVIRNRHQLICRRLSGTSEIEKTQIGIIVYIIEHHRLRRPVHDLVVIGLVIGLVMGDRRVCCSTQVDSEFVQLIAQCETCPMIVRLVLDAV